MERCVPLLVAVRMAGLVSFSDTHNPFFKKLSPPPTFDLGRTVN